MNEEDKLSKSDLDYIMNQLKQSQKETASTLAVQPARPIHLFQKFRLAKSWTLGIVIGVIVGLVISFAGDFLHKGETIKSATVVESVQKLATLATVQAHIETIVSKEDSKLFGKNISFYFPGTKRTFFLVASGEVTAGVDLKNLTKKDIILDTNTKAIHITLPHATIVQEPSIDSKNIQIFSNEGLFRSEPNGKEGFEQEDLAKQKIKKKAKESGLLKTAEDNARTALQDFYKIQDYTVTVTFK
ncbi:DUF4230 domain-containing protein [Neobacillus sp. MM2021_6]|uniref:DUF4230 domain-containing protein n=1 Tax=Bacillaceae TaxID=186817 RepID=UPI0014096FB3|nr:MULTISPECIES: DUF4230 domain-containing protein [Bacillaceae]MBO0959667.1 DUF4230 domain-containing protein [Neobacillus sp. MM2021_6]NHC19777.1 DUF4230 domain-containing protein [Bacillus sp. MM2020_4]